MNTITIIGNITRDPIIRYTNSGAAVINFGVASNRRWFDKSSDQWQEETTFFDVSAWRDLAENAALSLSKGSRVIVVGRLEQQTWTDDAGNNRSKLELVAEDIGATLRFNPVTIPSGVASPRSTGYTPEEEEPF